jgi:hypothetical protein
MTRLTFLPILILASAAVLGCSSDPAQGSASFPAAAFATTASESGALTLEVRTSPDQPPSRGDISVEYRITGADGAPAEGLEIAVEPWMPAMGHGASIVPVVADDGEGRYVVSSVDLFMAGTWELRTTIAGSLQDSATPTFQIP